MAFRKLTIRYDRHAATVLAFLQLACTLRCLRPRTHLLFDSHSGLMHAAVHRMQCETGALTVSLLVVRAR